MNESEINDFIKGMPKVENHLHLEGAIYPETMLEGAKKNNIDLPFKNIEESKDFYEFNSLGEFLTAFSIACSTVVSKEDFSNITYALGKEAKEQNIVYREVMFTYAYHQRRGVSLETVLEGLGDGRKRVEKDFGVKFAFIADIDRTIPETESMAFIESLLPYKEIVGIVGIGLDSQEIDYPASLHANTFKKAKELGFTLSAHGGEDVGAESVWSMINDLNVDRIDHGVRSIEDEELMAYLKDKKIPLTVCPISNVCLKIYPDLKSHPLKTFIERDMIISVNSDDPPFFLSNLNDNYIEITKGYGLSTKQISKVARQAYEIAFLSDEDKKSYLDRFDAYCSQYL